MISALESKSGYAWLFTVGQGICTLICFLLTPIGGIVASSVVSSCQVIKDKLTVNEMSSYASKGDRLHEELTASGY